LLFAAVSTRAATLSGTVRDSEGAVIPNAHVVVHWDPSGSNYLKDNIGIKQDVAAITDSSRQFSVEPPRVLRCLCDCDGFTPHCDKVRVKNKESRAYEVKLKISPVTSKELD
jgi:hypothetical protein